MVVTELKVLPLGDRGPLGFLPLLHTMDDSKKNHVQWTLANPNNLGPVPIQINES